MAADFFNRPMGTTLKYNPHLWSDEELRDIFVVRQAQLDHLLHRLRSTPPDVVPQATLLVGARGMGKTTLLRRLALAVRDDAELSRQWLPLSFPEEQYTVSSVAELWRNVLDALIDALEHAGASRAEIADLDRKARELADHPVESRAERVLALLAAWHQAHQRRLLLLIDSTDLLLEGLKRTPSSGVRKASKTLPAGKSKTPAARTDSALWQLRSTLVQSRHLMWVGATYQSLESQHAYDDAFHDFFDLIPLGPLDLDDMREALVALAGRFGMRGSDTPEASTQAMRRELDVRPERLQALKAITGVNPRTTAILYDLFATGHDGDLHSDLRGLLDLMTPLYKARMEQLPEQPRKLLAHIMEAWEPISVRELAQVSGVASTTVSSQLVRLEQDGLVQKTQLSGTRRTGYQVTERFFNIWFLMRHASRRVRQRLMWLVEFMRLWYRRDELEGLALRRTSFHQQYAFGSHGQAEYSRALARAMPEDRAALRIQLDYAVYREARERAQATNQRISDIYPELFDLQGEDKSYESGEQCHQRFLELRARLLTVVAEPGVDVSEWVRRVLGAVEAPLSEKRALAATTDRLTAEKAARAHLFPTRKPTRILFDYAFDKQTIHAVQVAMADGELLPDCADLTFFRAQIATKFGHDTAGTQLALLVFMRTANNETRLEVAHAIENTSPSHAGVFLLLARELVQVEPERSAALLADAVRIDPAVAPWAELMTAQIFIHQKRYDSAEAAYRKAIALDETSAWSWDNLADLLQYYLKRYEDAEYAYRKAISLDEGYVWPWYGLAALLHTRLKRYDEAEAAYREAIAIDEANGWAWNGLGYLLQAELRRYDEAEVAYRKAIVLDETSAAAWNNLGNLLQYCQKRDVEAEDAYLKAIAVAQTMGAPWIGLGNLLHYRLQRYDEAEAAYRKAIALNAEHAQTWANLANLLQDYLKRYDEAETAYRTAIALDETNAWTWNNLGNVLQYRLQRYEEAEAAYRKAIALDEASSDPWFHLGNLHKQLKRYEEAEAAYRKAIILNKDSALAWTSVGNLLQDYLKRYDEAEAAYRKAIELNEDYPWAWIALGNLLQYHLNRYDEAEAAYRQTIALEIPGAVPWNHLGNLLQYRLKRYGEAEVVYRKAIASDESDAATWVHFGNLLHYGLKRYGEAEAVYRQAIALDEARAWPWFGLGNLLQNHLKRYDEAEVAYRKAIALREGAAWSWTALGSLLENHLKRYDEAEAAYREAITLDEVFSWPWIGLGSVLKYHLKRYDEAEAAYRQAIALDDHHSTPWSGLGNLLKNDLKRYDEAEAAYRTAIVLDDQDETAWVGLGNLLQDHLKRPDEAEAAYHKAISLTEADAAPSCGPGDSSADADSAAPATQNTGSLNPFPRVNLARLLAAQGRDEEAAAEYRKVIELLSRSDQEKTNDASNLLLQAHLWLGNVDQASQALDRLVALASKGDWQAFSNLREQAFECDRMGMGPRLADLFARSSMRDFLVPFELALRASAAGSDEPLLGAPAETQAMAREVLRDLLGATGRL